jgi:hypothetical protein
MSNDTRSAPSTLAGLAAPSLNKSYPEAPTLGALRLLERTPTNLDYQIAGHEAMSVMGQGMAAFLSAVLNEPHFAGWLAEFRDWAPEDPAEADAIIAALVAYVRAQARKPR